MPSPIGHSIVGLYLYGRKANTKLSLMKCMKIFFWYLVFVNIPDLDYLPGILFGDPFLFHRGITHSLFFAVIFSFYLGVFLMTLGSNRPLFWGFQCFLGILSHIILDSFCFDPVNPQGILLLWPFSQFSYLSNYPFFPVLESNGSLLSFFTKNNMFLILIEAVLVGLVLMGYELCLALGRFMLLIFGRLAQKIVTIKPSWRFTGFFS